MIEEPSFIVDCSVAMTWCFSDEATPRTDALLERMKTHVAIVPAIWPLEVANVLIIAERQNRITQDESAEFVKLLRDLPIIVDSTQEMDEWNNTLMLGRSQGLTSYDAAYLKLAIRTGLPLATLDKDLIRAANALHLILI